MSQWTNTVAPGLTERTALAAMWRFAGSVIGAICDLGFGILLARLLSPTDFGVMALALVVLGAARPLGDLGIGDALVQRAQLTDRHIRTAFTFSVLLGLAIAAIMWASAPLSAGVMRDARVPGLMRVLALGFVFRGGAVVADALMRRQLEFRRQSLIEAGSAVAGFGLALGLALSGYGVWSLAWGVLLQGALTSMTQVAVMRHPVAPLLAGRELRDLFGFGLAAHLSSCMNYIALNGDNFVVGRLIGAASLGLYSRAYSLMNLPVVFAARVMSRVLFPVFAQVKHDPERLRRGYLLSTQLTAMIAAPCMATIGVAAPHLVATLYGPQWIGTVLPLQVLCGAGYFRALYHLGGAVAQGVGRMYNELWRQMVYGGLVIVGALIGSSYGLPGVAVGVGGAILFMFVASAQLALDTTGTPWASSLPRSAERPYYGRSDVRHRTLRPDVARGVSGLQRCDHDRYSERGRPALDRRLALEPGRTRF